MLYDGSVQREEWIKKKYPSRFRPYYFSDVPHREIKFVDLLVKSLNRVSRHFWVRSMIPDVYAGWNWFSWHKTVVDYVLRQRIVNPRFFTRFRYTQCCDEVIFHTLLHPLLDELHINSTTSLRYVNWHKSVPERKRKNAPLLLNEDEFDDIIGSGAFFCRKVHPVVSAKLEDMLASRVNASCGVF